MLTKTELEPSTCTVLMPYGSPSVPLPPNAIRAGGFLLVQTMVLRCFQMTHSVVARVPIFSLLRWLKSMKIVSPKDLTASLLGLTVLLLW